MSPRKSKAAAAEEQIEIPSRNVDGAKRAVLDKAVGDILKRYGDGSIMRLGEAKHMETEAFPTGSLSLDIALGVGGVPRGRITEIYGPESSGKTTICQHIVAEAQRMGGVAAFVDMEHASIPSMRRAWVWTSITCLSRSPIPVNRRSRSRKPSYALAASMWLSSTR